MVCKGIGKFLGAFGLCMGMLAFGPSPADAACFGGTPNGNTTGAEECDDGNLDDDDACSNACTLNICGNSRVDPPENCDDSLGTNASPAPVFSLTCNDDCTSQACPDGNVNSTFGVLGRPQGEECDDNNTNNTDACDNSCLLNVCGNGRTDSNESCDDGTGSNASPVPVETGTCDDDCTTPACGDFNTNEPSGEECDDGNNDDGDGCSAGCVVEFGDSVEVPAGENQTVSVLGGFSVPGGIDVTFEDTTGGTLEAGLAADPGTTNFKLASEPPLFLDITFDGGFSGDVTLVFGYDETTLDPNVQESQLVLYHFIDGAWRPVVPGIIDQNADTITVTIDSFSLFALGFARAQEKDQQKCINTLNKNLAKVAKAQGKSVCDCIKDFAKGQSLTPASTLELCLSTDRKGKVAKAQSKAESDEAKKCSASTPDFGATDSANVNDVALQAELDLIHDIFGSDLDTAIITEGDDKDTSKCQQQAAKAAKKCLDAKLKEFNKCKKNGLKDGSIRTFFDLQGCMGADPKGKIAKACDPVSGKIRSSIDKKCGPPVDTSTAFPGCATGDAAALAACLDQIVECHVCLALNQADGLDRNCEEFDDGEFNGSCP